MPGIGAGVVTLLSGSQFVVVLVHFDGGSFVSRWFGVVEEGLAEGRNISVC